MCGIISITGENLNKNNRPNIDGMLVSLGKRGPDDKGIMEFPNCTLGHTRLSIIDLSGGHQPMRDNKRDMATTFNGEIYNYRELKKEFENKGYSFSTNSDTEVILKAYQEYGADCPKYLDGMFAFAVWDNEKQELFLARDRFGKKPLYYAFDASGNLIAASEIKALFAYGIRGQIDPEAIDNYLALMYIPPHKTVYKNIYTLRPAECAIYRNGKLDKKTYWELTDKPVKMSYDEAKKEIKRLFEESVKKRMVADVEIGSFLSGGVDSTLVTAYAQKWSGKPIKTFSLGYGNHINELPFAKEASEKIGTDHHTLQASEDIMDALKESIAYFDEPHADSSDFPQSLLSRLTATKVKVALSGDGADELFMGYGWYQKHWHLPFAERLKQQIFSNPFAGYLKNISVFSESERKNLWRKNSAVNSNIFAKPADGKDSISKINQFDLTTYLPGQLLTKIDRMSMMHGLEVRSPFLDYKLAEFVYNLPVEFKLNKNENKIILKDILSEIMPKEFVYRRKQGFGAPVKEWLLENNVKEVVYESLGNSEARICSFFNPKTISKLLSDFYEKGQTKKHYKIWVLLNLELWLRAHKNEYERLF